MAEESPKRIGYKGGYKYQLQHDYAVRVIIAPDADVTSDFIDLSAAGLLVIKKNYAWDGPSGPTFDTPNFMRGSLVHDALYQLMRQDHLDDKVHRKEADKILKKICREDGMSAIRAEWVYVGVRLGGGPAAAGKPSDVIWAPNGGSEDTAAPDPGGAEDWPS